MWIRLPFTLTSLWQCGKCSLSPSIGPFCDGSLSFTNFIVLPSPLLFSRSRANEREGGRGSRGGDEPYTDVLTGSPLSLSLPPLAHFILLFSAIFRIRRPPSRSVFSRARHMRGRGGVFPPELRRQISQRRCDPRNGRWERSEHKGIPRELSHSLSVAWASQICLETNDVLICSLETRNESSVLSI